MIKPVSGPDSGWKCFLEVISADFTAIVTRVSLSLGRSIPSLISGQPDLFFGKAEDSGVAEQVGDTDLHIRESQR